MDILEFEKQLLAGIDKLLPTASTAEKAASEYLRGHVSLAVAHCQMMGRTHVRDVEMSVKRGLQQACLLDELQDAELKAVEQLWLKVLQSVSH